MTSSIGDIDGTIERNLIVYIIICLHFKPIQKLLNLEERDVEGTFIDQAYSLQDNEISNPGLLLKEMWLTMVKLT